MLFVELPYGITEGERASISDTIGIPFFSRNNYIAIPDDLLEAGNFNLDVFIHEFLPESITKYHRAIPIFKSVSYFSDQPSTTNIEVLSRDGTLLYYSGTDKLLFDIDTDDVMEAQMECRKLITYLNSIGIHKYDIFYSGSKGFHVSLNLIDIYGQFTLLHVDQIKLLVNTYITKLSGVVVDSSIYSMRSIIRLANTVNLKTGLYKIPITHEELFGDLGSIEVLALQPRNLPEQSYKPSDYTFIKNLLVLSGDLVQHNLDTKHNFVDHIDGNIDPVPFVEEYLERAELKPGTRHSVSLILAAYCRARGYTQSEAEDILADFMTRAVGSTTPVAQRVRESRNDVRTCYNKVIRFSKYKAMEVLE